MVVSLLGPLGRLQPCVLAGGVAYVKANAPGSEPALSLTTPRGVVHPLRRLGGLGALATWHNRLMLGELRRRVAAEVATLGAAETLDRQLEEFCLLADAFAAREAGPAFDAGLQEELDARLVALRPPELPTPALLLAGRVWRLAPARPCPGRLYVTVADRVGLRPSGEHVPLARLEAVWLERVGDLVGQVASQLAARSRRCSLEVLVAARAEFEQTGAVRRGALLLVAGNPPALGHLIPGGYFDPCLRRTSTGSNIAVTHPWGEPPAVSRLRAHYRGRSGWRSRPLPHGVCLGPGPLSLSEAPLALPGYLSWCAARIRTNSGAFHEAELR